MAHATEQYYASGLFLYPIGPRRMLLVSDEAGVIGEIEPAVGELLNSCRGSRSLDQHVMAATSTGEVRDPVAVRQVLSRFVEAGLLRSDEPMRALVADRSTSTVSALPTVAIVTADRPTLLGRCLTSLTGHCKEYGIRPRVVVVDGSRRGDSRTANREVLTNLIDRPRIDIRYLGQNEAAALRNWLVQSGLAQALVDFALTPGPVGANRNLALLASAGEDVLMLDDDVLCRPWTLPSCSEDLALGNHTDEREVAWFSARADAIAATSPVAVNLLQLHGAWLGQMLSDLVTRRSGELDLRNTCGHLLAALANNERSVVRATLMGVAGDSGMYSADRLLFGAGSTRARLASDIKAYRCAMNSREIVRVAPKYVLTHESGAMAYAMGVSNHTPPPPFMPLGRNEDGVFSAMVSFLEPLSLFAHLPVGIQHDSDRPSAYIEVPLKSATQTRLSELILALIRVCGSAAFSSSSDARRERLRAAFDEVADMPSGEFHRFSAHLILRARTEELRRAYADPCPPHIANELDRYEKALIEHSTHAEFFLPIEMDNAQALDDRARETQRFLGLFGELVRSWPRMWEAAQLLKGHDVLGGVTTRAEPIS